MTKSNRTITVSHAKEALADWDGMVEVSFHKIDDSATVSVAYDDIAYAVAYFNEIVTWYESGNFGGRMVILSKTWMEEPEDGCSRLSSWKSEPVI